MSALFAMCVASFIALLYCLLPPRLLRSNEFIGARAKKKRNLSKTRKRKTFENITFFVVYTNVSSDGKNSL